MRDSSTGSFFFFFNWKLNATHLHSPSVEITYGYLIRWKLLRSYAVLSNLPMALPKLHVTVSFCGKNHLLPTGGHLSVIRVGRLLCSCILWRKAWVAWALECYSLMSDWLEHWLNQLWPRWPSLRSAGALFTLFSGIISCHAQNGFFQLCVTCLGTP